MYEPIYSSKERAIKSYMLLVSATVVYVDGDVIQNKNGFIWSNIDGVRWGLVLLKNYQKFTEKYYVQTYFFF